MKTIFIFNDSRPTDRLPCIVALGEDACLFARVEFDGRTREHIDYAFGCAHSLPADLEESVADPLNATRTGMFAAYDRIYGSGNWMPLWLDAPTKNDAWLKAIEIFHRHPSKPCLSDVRFSDAALGRILEAIAGAPVAPLARVVH
ncbi:hypothetical protein LMG28688_01577 [Paraburkholderia caffeinitolerans]|uniref:Uncharacterized protein n=1 Tax=Paraburkholderia caffeinitolerans TaxID=1723730 RepID=A0A6J5FRX3_9BURK|nr:hypothetical protein [Paraburkholderia caffeinitolerans]CAB3783091.1 hypothetical protein LMG28688_01577 [Paraburkholderia caffeinitolerans]